MAEKDQDETNETAESKGLRGTLDSAREALGSSLDRVSGTEYRRQFEQFANVVETAVVGVHRDQIELNLRLEKVEQAILAARTTPTNQKLVVGAFVLSFTAAVLAIAALAVSI